MGRAAAKPDRIIPVNEEIPISPGTQAARRKIPMMQSAIICIPSRRNPTQSSAGGTPVDWAGQMSELVVRSKN